MSLTEIERNKYRRIWEIDEYRSYSPGIKYIDRFLAMTEPDSVIDFGCGTGRAALVLHHRGYIVTAVDFAENSIEVELPFVNACLWEDIGVAPVRYGYCTDVMEHIPTEKVDDVLENITSLCDEVFFSISFRDDSFGKFIDEQLHMTVRKADWWSQKLSNYGEITRATADGVFYLVTK